MVFLSLMTVGLIVIVLGLCAPLGMRFADLFYNQLRDGLKHGLIYFSFCFVWVAAVAQIVTWLVGMTV